MHAEHLFMIVASAFMHALYNCLLKQHGRSAHFLPALFAVATGLAWAVVWHEGGLGAMAWRSLPTVYLAALFYVMYQLCCSKAYRLGEISTLYPLTVLGPVLIPVWAGVFLAERLAWLAVLGIGLTVAGAICVKLQTLSWQEARKAFAWHGDYAGARWALAASLVYSVGAIFDKASVSRFSGTSYLAFILLFMTLNLGLAMAWARRSLPEVCSASAGGLRSCLPILLGGLALYLSFMFFRVALKEVYVSVATPIRQVSILFAMGFGVLFLKEKLGKSKLLGATLILAGVVLLAFSRR